MYQKKNRQRKFYNDFGQSPEADTHSIIARNDFAIFFSAVRVKKIDTLMTNPRPGVNRNTNVQDETPKANLLLCLLFSRGPIKRANAAPKKYCSPHCASLFMARASKESKNNQRAVIENELTKKKTSSSTSPCRRSRSTRHFSHSSQIFLAPTSTISKCSEATRSEHETRFSTLMTACKTIYLRAL